MKTMLKPIVSAIFVATSLAACSNLGIKPLKDFAPEYEQPVVEMPETFRYDVEGATEGVGIQAASLGWKDYFADPRLHALIDIALKNNTDLRIANLNVEQVRTQYAITKSGELPSVNASSNISRSGNLKSFDGNTGYRVGLASTAFELDLWGRVKNSSDAALQDYFKSEAARDSTHLSLIANVAKAHFNELAATERIKLAERTLASYRETYRLIKLRHQAGVASALDLATQEAQIESAKSNYADAIRAQERARNALSLLISEDLPRNLPKPLPLSKQYKIRSLPAGLPSQVLLNRPDIRAAELDLKKANANIGVARAAFFPTISLTSSVGLASSQLSNLFKAGSGSWSVGGGINLPIFDWGRNQSNLEATKIAQQKTIVAYEAAVESAFRDVSDALVGRAALNSQLKSQTTQRDVSAKRLNLIQLRYKHGVSSSLDLLDAQRSQYGAESGVLSTQVSLLENLADLYKALGGGLKRLTEDEAMIQSQIQAYKEGKIQAIEPKAEQEEQAVETESSVAQQNLTDTSAESPKKKPVFQFKWLNKKSSDGGEANSSETSDSDATVKVDDAELEQERARRREDNSK